MKKGDFAMELFGLHPLRDFVFASARKPACDWHSETFL
jgi:hypothetical protein